MVAQAWNAPAADKDFWHVLVGPGETKILSLEQLDDFFRLEVIDASTRVWQPGMTEWLPLSVVAGIEDEPAPAPARPPAPPSRAPQPPSRAPQPPSRAPQPPSRAPQPVAAALPVAAPIPRTQTATAWPPQATPAWPAQAAAPQAAAWPAQQATAWPPVTQAASAWPGSAPAAAPQRPQYASPESVRPLVIPQTISPPARQGSRMGTFLVSLAVVGACAVTLYRNDVLRELAKSAGQERAYLQIERSLGSPGFGTPRAVEHLALLTPTFGSDTSPSKTIFSSLPSRPSTSTTRSTESGSNSGSSNSGSSNSASATTDSSNGRSSNVNTGTGSATEPAAPRKSLESLVAAQIATPTLSKKRAPQRESERPAPARRERDAPEPSLGIKGSSNRFDPLNGKL